MVASPLLSGLAGVSMTTEARVDVKDTPDDDDTIFDPVDEDAHLLSTCLPAA